MFYTVYKTINIHNQKFYIGVHKTIDPNDDYLGSGKLIKFAIKKYGKASFKKTILFIFDHREEAYLKERELVTPELMISDACYNLARGGNVGCEAFRTALDTIPQKEQRVKHWIHGHIHESYGIDFYNAIAFYNVARAGRMAYNMNPYEVIDL